MEYSNKDAFEHINNALTGDLPSFGIAKESKFQHLMQRNQDAGDAMQHPNHMFAPPDMMNAYDTSLSVEAKSFRPTTGNQFLPPTMPNQLSQQFENLEVSANAGKVPSSGMVLPYMQNNQPNPSANEFIPRNLSAPILNQNGGIPEFIPKRPPSRINGIQQPQQMGFLPQGNAFAPPPMGSQINGGNSESQGPRMSQQIANNPVSSIVDFIPASGTDPRLSASSVFTSPQSQSNSSTYFTGDSSTPQTASSIGGQRLAMKRRAGSRDLKESFRFIEEYVQRFLNKAGGRNVSNTSAFSTPGTSSPFPPRPTMDSLTSSLATPERTSPLLTRRLNSHRSSPSIGPISTGVNIDQINMAHQPYSEAESRNQGPMAQENGGTTYFYTQKPSRGNISVVVPSYHIFPGSPPNIEYMSLRANAPSFFMCNELRQAIMQKQALTMLTVDTEQDPSIPSEVDNYHSLFPLEPAPENPLQKSSTFGFITSCYKAIKYKDGLPYCLRRIHGFRQFNEKCMVLVEMWKKLQHGNVVQLREVFTSKAFGEHSLIFAHDYHAGAETMMSRHFQNPSNNFASKAKWNGGTARQNAGLLPESLIWTYVVQLTSALRCIHTAGLACRVLDPTKIVITDKSRVRINGVGIFDVLGYDNSHSNPRAHMQQYQQDDMIALGKVVLALACNSVTSIQRDNLPKSIDLVVMNYSSDLKNLILYLLTPQQRPHSVNDIMPMIGARFYTQLDAAMLRCDVIENELAKPQFVAASLSGPHYQAMLNYNEDTLNRGKLRQDVENGRLFRMLSKLGVINERPEFGMDHAWSETGDRYLLKLFRDHLFHQVTETGAPWIDLAHIVQCLNKLDAGVPEKLCLMSRDEQNILVVSYHELKKAFSKCFSELVNKPAH